MLRMNFQPYDFNYQVYQVDEAGTDIALIALANHADVAIRAFEAARGTVSHSTVQLRNKARIMRTARTGGFDMATGKVEQP